MRDLVCGILIVAVTIIATTAVITTINKVESPEPIAEADPRIDLSKTENQEAFKYDVGKLRYQYR